MKTIFEVIAKILNIIYPLRLDLKFSRKCPNARTRFGGNFNRSGEIFINNSKTENKWKFLLTGANFHKHQSK